MTREQALDAENEALRVQVEELQMRLAAIREEYFTFEIPGAEMVELTGIERNVAKMLHDHAGKVVGKDRIHHNLYALRLAGDEVPEPTIVDVIICKLRAKLKKGGTRWAIETMWGVGYKLTERAA